MPTDDPSRPGKLDETLVFLFFLFPPQRGITFLLETLRGFFFPRHRGKLADDTTPRRFSIREWIARRDLPLYFSSQSATNDLTRLSFFFTIYLVVYYIGRYKDRTFSFPPTFSRQINKIARITERWMSKESLLVSDLILSFFSLYLHRWDHKVKFERVLFYLLLPTREWLCPSESGQFG